MLPLVQWLLVVGEKGLAVVKNIEARTATPLPNSFGKILEPMKVPADCHLLADQMLAEDKPSAALFQLHVKTILQARWEQWVLFHPDLQPKYVHPSRGVHFLLPSSSSLGV